MKSYICTTSLIEEPRAPVNIGDHDDVVLMMMYDDVIIARASDLADRNFSIL
ncbi:MAG: hypothetical protein K2M67_02980 [Muribaculaceae bacterium]|nr:hypothetical protein [Muribaculaceae bacterium]